MTEEERAAENETEETVEGEALAEGATPQEVGEDESGEEETSEEETEEEGEAEEQEVDAEAAIRETVEKVLREGKEESEAKALDRDAVMDFVAAAAGLVLPEVPPVLTPDQKKNLTDIEVEQYDTNRSVKLMKAEQVRDNAVRMTNGVTSIIASVAEKFTDEAAGITVSETEIFDYMREKNLYSPEDAAKSLTYDARMAYERGQGAKEALKKVGKPVKPAKTLKGTGRSVSTKASYKSESDALAGGMSVLDSMRSS